MQVRSALEVQKTGNEGYEADWIATMKHLISFSSEQMVLWQMEID
jgi:hypothetical protein